jgi:predicted RNA-binding Zn ribbon-like protein
VSDFRTGNGADWLDLLATLLGRYRTRQTDQLASAESLRAWLAEHGMEPLETPGTDDLEAARVLREALHRTAVATLDGRPAEPSDVTIMQRALGSDQPLRLGPDEAVGLRVDRPADTAAALARLTRQAAVDLAGPTRRRLRACDDGTCSGLFIDHSGRRRWCSDERCGVRSRVRAHRARGKAPDGG